MLEAWCCTAADGEPDTDGAWTRAELEEHVRDRHSAFTWLHEPTLERAGFAVLERQHRG